MRRRHRAIAIIVCSLAAGAAGAPARAQEAAPPPAAGTRAQALFDEGKRLYEEKRFAEACARLAESERLDPAVGTLGLLAGCHEAEGKIATAYREFLATARRADQAGDDRADFARQRASALEPRLPKLLIRVAAGAGVEVLRDGVVVPESEIGVEAPVDPGAHEIVARAPGKVELRRRITATEGARVTVEVPALAPAPAEGSREPAAVPAAPARASAAATAPEDGSRRTAALVIGGLGVVGIGVGAAFGVSAVGKHVESRTLERTCSTAAQCEEGERLRDATYTAGTISTIAFGVGVAGLGVGAFLLLTADGGSSRQGGSPAAPVAAIRVAPLLGPEGGGASLAGRF